MENSEMVKVKDIKVGYECCHLSDREIKSVIASNPSEAAQAALAMKDKFSYVVVDKIRVSSNIIVVKKLYKDNRIFDYFYSVNEKLRVTNRVIDHTGMLYQTLYADKIPDKVIFLTYVWDAAKSTPEILVKSRKRTLIHMSKVTKTGDYVAVDTTKLTGIVYGNNYSALIPTELYELYLGHIDKYRSI